MHHDGNRTAYIKLMCRSQLNSTCTARGRLPCLSRFATEYPFLCVTPHHTQGKQWMCGRGLPPRHRKSGMLISVEGVTMRRTLNCSLRDELGLTDSTLVPLHHVESRGPQWSWRLACSSVMFC